MTSTPEITQDMVRARGTKLAMEMRANGLPIMGVDAADDTLSVGLVFKLPNGRLADFRLHYDDAKMETYCELLEVFMDV